MAVVAGKRKDGELKFLTNSAQLAKYTMDICGNEKCFPKRYRWCFIGKIVDAAIEVFVVAFRANKVYVEPGDMDAAMRRFNLQSESIEASYQLEALANLAYMMFGLEESRIEFWTFLSTLPARGATIFLFDLDGRDHISIHAPREGSDLPTAR